MTKKLSAKTQELNPKLPQFSSSFSKCVNIEPDTQDILLKKGTVYSLFEISGESNFDTDFVTKVVTDILHNTYYESDNISPIQSMEKTITEIREKILQLSSDALISTKNDVAFNFVSAVLWGNVLYIIRLGEIENYTMRGGEIVPLEMISEGNFSSFSKIVNEDDIFIFCTKSFSQIYPPERLLQTSIPESNLDQNQACLLFKLLLDTKLPQNIEIDLGLGEAVQKSQQREFKNTAIIILKRFGLTLLKVQKKILIALTPLAERVSRLIGKIIPKRKMVLFTRKIAQTTEGKNKKIRGWVFLSLIAVLAALLIFYIFKSAVFKDKPQEKTETTIVEELKPEEEIVVEDRSKDEEYKILRVKPEVFYDIKIADAEANPSDLQLVKDKLIVVDKDTGKIFKSDAALPNFANDTNIYKGIRSLAQTEGLLSFLDNTGYKTYDIEKSSIKDSYELDPTEIAYPYVGNIYSISGDILNRYSVKNGSLEKETWGQNQDFQNANSIAIAYSIYVLKENGEMVSYSGGAKTDFTVTGLDKPFANPVKVVTDIDFSNIYVADKGNNRVVVIDKDGALIEQYKNDDDSLWKDIKGISVSSDEKTIFILDSNKIFKLQIEE